MTSHDQPNLCAIICHHDGSRTRTRTRIDLTPGIPVSATVEAATWRLSVTAQVDGALVLTASVVAGNAPSASVALVLDCPWSADAWVGIPAAAYNGNRFPVREVPYPPMFRDPADVRADLPITITAVPRLVMTGPSALHLLAGDTAAPAIGWHLPGSTHGAWLLGPADATLGLRIEEDDDRRRARLWLQSPGVRPEQRYVIASQWTESLDRGRDLSAGEVITIAARLVTVPATGPADLWRAWTNLRRHYAPSADLALQLPLSAAWSIQESKRTTENWQTNGEYLRIGTVDHQYQDWQPGWVGGGMDTLAMLAHGGADAQAKARSTLDFLCGPALAPSGWCHGTIHNGVVTEDGFDTPQAARWVLTRKTADALYFLLKQLALLEAQGESVKPAWIAGARSMTEALVKLWDHHGQFGQFVDIDTGLIAVGGSTAAGIAPAALILAWRRFADLRYRTVAEAGARLMADTAIALGATTGGPGEILQCPDSESCFGLLESLVVLHEHTGDACWLPLATALADQCTSWVQAWDFPFPATSTFGKLGMQACGSVWANVQNKHSAPAICTLSGDSLLKLTRATGDRRWLDLLAEITRGILQYLSRTDRPIAGMPAGWMNERVETSDWLEPPGEIFHGSCWCEVSLMLAWSELPGVYVRSDLEIVTVIDHIEARLVRDGAGLSLHLRNPTAFPASVKLLVEDAAAATRPLGPCALAAGVRIDLPAGASIRHSITT